MTEIDKEKIARIVGFDEDAENLKKKVSITGDEKQFTIRIPKKFAELAKIRKKIDQFEFTLVPKEQNHEFEYTIEADLVRG